MELVLNFGLICGLVMSFEFLTKISWTRKPLVRVNFMSRDWLLSAVLLWVEPRMSRVWP